MTDKTESIRREVVTAMVLADTSTSTCPANLE